MKVRYIGAVIMLWITVSSAVFGQTLSDIAKEKRWADQIIDTLFDGDAIWLKADDHQFLGIEMLPEDSSTKQGIILLHGIGVHPNWEQVIRPLRVGMTEEGWHTLSIQMPVLANDADPNAYGPLFQEVPGRINAAIDYLNNKGVRDIVLIGHSMGSAMTVGYLSSTEDSVVKAAILIALNAERNDLPVDIAAGLKAISLPVLDIYGAEDLEGVIATAPKRANAMFLAGHPGNLQVKMDGANHFFDGKEEPLLELVLDWINAFH